MDNLKIENPAGVINSLTELIEIIKHDCEYFKADNGRLETENDQLRAELEMLKSENDKLIKENAYLKEKLNDDEKWFDDTFGPKEESINE